MNLVFKDEMVPTIVVVGRRWQPPATAARAAGNSYPNLHNAINQGYTRVRPKNKKKEEEISNYQFEEDLQPAHSRLPETTCRRKTPVRRLHLAPAPVPP